MILKGKFTNIFGLKEFSVDFGLKHVNGKDQSDQVLRVGSITAAMVPTILAKNASGKTSLIKAISFALRFSNFETFINAITKYKFAAISAYMNNRMEAAIDTNEVQIAISSKKIIKDLFNEISFAGQEFSRIEIVCLNKKNIVIEATPFSFTIVINGEVIDLESVLDKINIKNLQSKTPRNVVKEIRELATKNSKHLPFFQNSKNYDLIFRDNASATEASELNIKNRTNIYISKIIENTGFTPLKMLIMKLDTNIKNISIDQENQQIEIYIKGSDVPISAKNLSFGTQKILEILFKSLPHFQDGGVMMIDEIENGLHLSLIKLLVSLFEDEEVNTAGAQLILTTHNPLIAERGIVRSNNIFIQDDIAFMNVKKVKLTNSEKRNYSMEKMTKSKNYYNDLFWIHNNQSTKSTLSDMAISQIVNSMQKDINWQAK